MRKLFALLCCLVVTACSACEADNPGTDAAACGLLGEACCPPECPPGTLCPADGPGPCHEGVCTFAANIDTGARGYVCLAGVPTEPTPPVATPVGNGGAAWSEPTRPEATPVGP